MVAPLDFVRQEADAAENDVRVNGSVCTCVAPYGYADPDCELHFPSMIEDRASRLRAQRYWKAGFEAAHYLARNAD